MNHPVELIKQLIDENEIETLKKEIRDEAHLLDDHGGAVIGVREEEPKHLE